MSYVLNKLQLIVNTNVQWTKQKIKELTNNSVDVVYIDTNNKNKTTWLNELSQTSLLGVNQSFVFEDVNVFANLSAFNETLNVLEDLVQADCLIILVCNKISNAAVVANFINNYCTLWEPIELTKNNAVTIVNELLIKAKLKLPSQAINILIERCCYDYSLLVNEIKKLSIYCSCYKLDQASFNLLVSDYNNGIYYELVSYLYQQNYSKLWTLVNSLLVNQTQPVSIMTMLGTMLSKHYFFLYLQEQNKPFKEILESLQMSSFAAKMLAKMLVSFKSELILDKIKTLLAYEYLIKTNQINQDHALHYWIVMFHENHN